MKKLSTVLAVMVVLTITAMSFSSNFKSNALAGQYYEYTGTTVILPGDGLNGTEAPAFLTTSNWTARASLPTPCNNTPKLCAILIDPAPGSTAEFANVLNAVKDFFANEEFPGAGVEFEVTVDQVVYKIKIFLKA